MAVRVLVVAYGVVAAAFLVVAVVQLAAGTHSWPLWVALGTAWSLVIGMAVELRRATHSQATGPSAADTRRAYEKERSRQQRVVNGLWEEWKMVGTDLTAPMVAGNEPLPKEWVEERLQEMGEGFRYTEYRPG